MRRLKVMMLPCPQFKPGLTFISQFQVESSGELNGEVHLVNLYHLNLGRSFGHSEIFKDERFKEYRLMVKLLASIKPGSVILNIIHPFKRYPLIIIIIISYKLGG